MRTPPNASLQPLSLRRGGRLVASAAAVAGHGAGARQGAAGHGAGPGDPVSQPARPHVQGADPAGRHGRHDLPRRDPAGPGRARRHARRAAAATAAAAGTAGTAAAAAAAGGAAAVAVPDVRRRARSPTVLRRRSHLRAVRGRAAPGGDRGLATTSTGRHPAAGGARRLGRARRRLRGSPRTRAGAAAAGGGRGRRGSAAVPPNRRRRRPWWRRCRRTCRRRCRRG